mgnify:CR=1 FL=1
MTTSITTTLRSRNGLPPNKLLTKIADHILGSRYDLSVAFVGDDRARTLNKHYKQKDTPTNVLSFPLSDASGEIIINPRRAARDARHFNHTLREHIIFLFIHGLLHLKGHTHGATMESEEQRLLRKFG